MAAYLPYAIGAVGFIALVMILNALLGSSGQVSGKRLKNTVGNRSLIDPRQRSSQEANMARRRQTLENIRAINESQRASRRQLLTLQARLTQAGLKWSATGFWIGSLVCGAVLCGLAIVSGINVELIPFSRPVIIVAAAIVGVIGLPRWVLNFILKGRQTKFSEQFADGLEVIVRGVRSGLPLTECLQIIARESPEPLKSEFLGLTDNLSMGVTVETATAKLYERMPLPEVNFFQIVLGIQGKSGGNLTEALANLAAVLRARRLMKEKTKALSSEAKASAWIIGSLPIIVMTLVYFSTPSYITLLFTTALGNLILVIGGVTMSVGIMIMKNMIDFDF